MSDQKGQHFGVDYRGARYQDQSAIYSCYSCTYFEADHAPQTPVEGRYAGACMKKNRKIKQVVLGTFPDFCPLPKVIKGS